MNFLASLFFQLCAKTFFTIHITFKNTKNKTLCSFGALNRTKAKFNIFSDSHPILSAMNCFPNILLHINYFKMKNRAQTNVPRCLVTMAIHASFYKVFI